MLGQDTQLIRKPTGYAGRYKQAIYLVPRIVLLDVIGELSMPPLMSRIVDVGIASKDLAYIARIGLYMVLLALGAMASGAKVMRLSTFGSMGFGADLRDALFSMVQRVSFANIDHFSAASLVTRLTSGLCYQLYTGQFELD